MKACILRYVPIQGPAYIGRWLLNHDVSYLVVHPYRGEDLTSQDHFDPLAVLGGPMTTNEVERCPWLWAAGA